MQDMFCFAQLLHQGTFSTEPRLIGDRLAVCEVPDVLRALGYFPSQFEINTMVREVLRSGDTISSSELVKMLVNYKPSYGVSLDQLREAFSVFGFPSGNDIVMSKEKFLSVLLDKGEAMDLDEALDVLRMLLKGEAAFDAEAEGLYGHLLMDEAARREKLFYFLPEVPVRRGRPKRKVYSPRTKQELFFDTTSQPRFTRFQIQPVRSPSIFVNLQLCNLNQMNP
ncbi:cilia- and flagella-associated protein 251-like [Thrips palmi]|uniref:Cilia- and flagella-associated protein 251-like n=1 Tax=Thrips palmi TaxID=161013 RepID=A0A6P8YZF9_THRPL|nr:cilia- and flagella-associated protein 251-like [Thrips palmi]